MRTFSAVLASAITIALAGCATSTEEQRTAPGAQARDMPRSERSAASNDAPRAYPPGSSPSASRPSALGVPEKRAIYFDYDQVDIKPEYRPLVEAHAKYLREHGDARTVIQGHADERGSREYNVALGQRRAESVKSMLTLMGASEKQLEAVSLGEEKPVCAQSSEACWRQNRRGQLLYPGEY